MQKKQNNEKHKNNGNIKAGPSQSAASTHFCMRAQLYIQRAQVCATPL